MISTALSPKNVSEQFLTEQVSVGWPWRILIFSVIIFALSLLVYFGLRFGYGPYLESRSESFDQKLTELTQTINLEDQERFVNFYSQLVNLKGVLENHPFASNVFQFLERNTIDSVYFNEANIKESGRFLSLKGFSVNIQSLTEQIAVLEQASEVESVLLNDVAFTGGVTGFNISIIFRPDFLTRPL
jgi:hypothetical protein